MARKILRHWPLLLAALLLLICGLCLLRLHAVKTTLDSQYAAARWKGGNEQDFAQLSCFLPESRRLTREELHSFKNEMYKKLVDASFDPERDTGLYNDAWSVTGTVKVGSGQRSGEVRAVAVGGRFFDFHPLRLLSGNYLSPDDVMDDRVLLDRETAWLLFGGTDLAGMSFSLNGTPFVVAGVYEHADDRFSKKADAGGMCIYMSYDAYEALNPDTTAIACYELVMAEPVKGFVRTAAQEKFPVKSAELVENSYRFENERLLKLVKNSAERSMRKGGAVYPDWETAARAAVDSAAGWLIAAIATGLPPFALALVGAVRYAARGKTRLQEDTLPRLRERVEEALRVRARRRWEKKHPDMK